MCVKQDRGKMAPSMAHTDNMIHIAQTEFQQLVRNNAACITESK